MQKQIIASLFFLSAFSFVSFGQQNSKGPSRQLDAFQLFEIQRGEVELFKTLVYRYEIAWEESDVQSMVDLRDGLMKLMEVEIKQAEDNKVGNPTAENRLVEEKASLKQIKDTPFSEGDRDLGKRAEFNKSVFNDFIKIMEADLTEQQLALRPADKN